MRCTKYNVGENVSSNMKKNLTKYGILVRVDAIPDAGKVITESHGELINGQWIEIIDEQKTVLEINSANAIAKNVFTQRQIRLAMRELGQEALLNGLLQDTDFNQSWIEAREIDLNDPETQEALALVEVDIDAVKLAIAGILPAPVPPVE